MVTTIEGYEELYQRAIKLRTQLVQIIQETEARVGQAVSGRDKILLVCHSRTMRALSGTGVDFSEKPPSFHNSLRFANTCVTPYQVIQAEDGSQQLKHFGS